MIGLGSFGTAFRRAQKLKAYRKARAEAEAMSDADLADIGLKRYQLGHVARVRAFS